MDNYVCKHCGDTYFNKSNSKTTCNTCRNGLRRYGMTKLDMEKMWQDQNNECYLCSKEVEMFTRGKTTSGYIDHCHKSGAVRSILCHICNTAVGFVEYHNISIEKLSNYVERRT